MSHSMQNLSNEDIERYRHQIKAEGQKGIIKTYEELEQKGYRYATLAKNVVKGNSPAGVIALEHMNTVAQSNWGRALTKIELDKVYHHTAQAYLDFLGKQINQDSPGNSMREISYLEAQTIHDTLFEEMELGKEAWTLYLPFKLMTEAEQILYWEDVLNSAGSNLKEVALAARTTFNVLREGIS